ncbi:hypothetical protein TNCT_517701 [Trichonephila clavata]|uniref:Uncharacterized protein n=1 Tax=Trichonephila clavata TaxID=2740835 RepID=A0A8X6LKX5_TRICU|nr:hypothetical protein TNCT_517701 [Trichonephila clavata]
MRTCPYAKKILLTAILRFLSRMSDIPVTSNMEDTFLPEERKSPDTSTEESKRTDGSRNEASSSGPETDEPETPEDKSEEEKIVPKDETAETNSDKDEPSSNTESSSPETDESKTTDKNGEGKTVSKDETNDKESSSGHATDESKTTGDKNGDEKVCDKGEGASMASLHDKIQKMSEKFQKVTTFLNQDEGVQQWIKTANDPNVPLHLKETEIVARGAVTWLNALKNFDVLSDLFPCSQYPSEETGMPTSDKEKTASPESVPTPDKEKTGATKSVDLPQCLVDALRNAEENLPLIEELAIKVSNASESIKRKSTNLPCKDFVSSDSSSKCEVSTRTASTTTPHQITTENLKDEEKIKKLEEICRMFEGKMDEFIENL